MIHVHDQSSSFCLPLHCSSSVLFSSTNQSNYHEILLKTKLLKNALPSFFLNCSFVSLISSEIEKNKIGQMKLNSSECMQHMNILNLYLSWIDPPYLCLIWAQPMIIITIIAM